MTYLRPFPILFYCLFAICSVKVGQAANPEPVPSPAGPSIMIFGDSLTDGNALGANGRERVWVSLAQKKAGKTLRLINEGKGGRQTNSVKQFDEAIARNPKLSGIVIMLGTNDSRDVSGQCVPKAVANITEMIEHARKVFGKNIRVLIIAPPNIRKDALVASKPIANEREANLKALEGAYRELATKLDAKFTSLYGIVPDGTLKSDGVHPNPEGNQVMAEALLPELVELVSK